MFDPTNDLDWTGGIISSRPAQAGELAVGSTVERTARFLGRTFTYGYVVSAAEPERMVEMRVERPFPMLIRYELADAGAATTDVAIRATGTPGRFFRALTPFMAWQVHRSIRADLERLRARLEADPGSERPGR